MTAKTVGKTQTFATLATDQIAALAVKTGTSMRKVAAILREIAAIADQVQDDMDSEKVKRNGRKSNGRATTGTGLDPHR